MKRHASLIIFSIFHFHITPRWPATPGYQMVFGSVNRNPVYPGIKSAFAPEILEGAISLDERLLGHIHCLVLILHEPADHGQYLVLVLGNEKVKRPLVTLLNPLHQPAISFFFAHPVNNSPNQSSGQSPSQAARNTRDCQ